MKFLLIMYYWTLPQITLLFCESLLLISAFEVFYEQFARFHSDRRRYPAQSGNHEILVAKRLCDLYRSGWPDRFADGANGKGRFDPAGHQHAGNGRI